MIKNLIARVWYIHPCNNDTDMVVSRWLAGKGIDHKVVSRFYRGKLLEDLIVIKKEFIDYWEETKRSGSETWFKLDLYSEDKNGKIRKHEFPRKRERIVAVAK